MCIPADVKRKVTKSVEGMPLEKLFRYIGQFDATDLMYVCDQVASSLLASSLSCTKSAKIRT